MAVADTELNPEPTTCDVESYRLLLHTPTCAQTTGLVIFPANSPIRFGSIALEIESKREAIVIQTFERSDQNHSFGDFDFGLESQRYVDGTGDEA